MFETDRVSPNVGLIRSCRCARHRGDLVRRWVVPHTSSMPGAAMSSSEDLVVALDYGQFYLHTSEEDPELAVDLLGEAQGAAGIAQQGGLVVIESPHQNNFEMPLRVEVWTAQPGDNLDDWEDAFEVHLVVGHDGLMYESPTLDMTPLPVPLGSYYAIITGRGFVGHGWPGSTTPGDSWRIRVWPSDGPSNPARLRRFTDPDDTDDAPRGATRSSSRRDTDGLGYDPRWPISATHGPPRPALGSARISTSHRRRGDCHTRSALRSST